MRIAIFRYDRRHCLIAAAGSDAGAGQAIQPINIATSASGQSGYVAALIEEQRSRC